MGTATYFIILAIFTILVIALSIKTCLLSDIVVSPLTFHVNADKEKIEKPQAPFSLARTQLAFWTVIVFSSFLYILFKHDFDVPEINNVNLVLLGIAVATTAAGKLIDNSQKNNPDLSQNYPSQGFLTDILSDKNGVSIHRLQNVLWTLALGIIYIHYVAAEATLPDETVITENLLMLMGISTGAYVGIKTTENAR